MSPVPADPRIEAAARALHQADGNIGKLSWDDWLGDEARETYRELARAALAAADAVLTPPDAEQFTLDIAWALNETEQEYELHIDTLHHIVQRLIEKGYARAAVVSPPDLPSEYEEIEGWRWARHGPNATMHRRAPQCHEYGCAPVFRRVVRDENENTK